MWGFVQKPVAPKAELASIEQPVMQDGDQPFPPSQTGPGTKQVFS